jgi:hypothetical protein
MSIPPLSPTSGVASRCTSPSSPSVISHQMLSTWPQPGRLPYPLPPKIKIPKRLAIDPTYVSLLLGAARSMTSRITSLRFAGTPYRVMLLKRSITSATPPWSSWTLSTSIYYASGSSQFHVLDML